MTTVEKPRDAARIVRNVFDRKTGTQLVTSQMLGGYGDAWFTWTFDKPGRVCQVRVYPDSAYIVKFKLGDIESPELPDRYRAYSFRSPADRMATGEVFRIEVAAPQNVQSIAELDIEYLHD